MARKTGEEFDQFPNRKYQVVTWAAATTTFAAESFSTEMGARTKNGWIIERIYLRPRGLLAPPSGGASHTLRFQVATGSQTAMLTADDDQVIATLDLNVVFNAAGIHVMDTFPLVWIGPVLIASRQLTFGMQGNVDTTPYQAVDMLFTVWYRWMALEDRDWLEIAEAKGIF